MSASSHTRSFLPDGTFVGWELDDALAPERCAAILRGLVARGFERTGELYPAGYRDNDRLVFDDPALADALFHQLRDRLPRTLSANGQLLANGQLAHAPRSQEISRDTAGAPDDGLLFGTKQVPRAAREARQVHWELGETNDVGEERWELVGFNPRFRACRYEGGQSFCIHRDGPFVPDEDHRSLLTIQFYLDDDPARTGGHTRFYADARGQTTWASIAPRAGTAIVFDHRVWHDGEPVTTGIKHVLRTDAIFRRVEEVRAASGPRLDRVGGADRVDGQDSVDRGRADDPENARVFGRHRGYAWHVVGYREQSDHREVIASAGRDGTVRFWREPGAPHIVDLGRGSVTCLAPTQHRMWCGLRSGEVWVIDGAAHEMASGLGAITSAATWPPHREQARSMDARKQVTERPSAPSTHIAALTPDIGATSSGELVAFATSRSELVVFATSRGEIVAFDESTRAHAWTVRAHDGWAWGIAATDRGFVSCGHDGRVNHIDLAGRVRTIAELGVPVRAIASLAPAVNEVTIIAGDERGWLHWLAGDGRVVRSHRAHAATVTSIATRGERVDVGRQNGTVISAGEDGIVARWHGSGEREAVLLERDDFITSIAITRDGDIVTAGYDGALCRILAPAPQHRRSSPQSPIAPQRDTRR